MLKKEKNTSPAYSLGIKFKMPNIPGALGELCVAIGKAGGNIISIGGFDVYGNDLTEEILINCQDEKHMEKIIKTVESLKVVEIIHFYDRTFQLHEGGKIEVKPLLPLENEEQLSMAYTPGVARICEAIAETPEKAYEYTIKKNTVAIVTDGTAVLGLGNIGPKAALPVMEGKALLFKEFAKIDAVPICLDVSSPAQVIETVESLAPGFGGINLEDIAAPGCFEVEERLKESLDIPVFHDDQHGTAIVVLAALKNALKIVDKKITDINVTIAGTGAAGVAIGKLIQSVGVPNIIGVDRDGIIDEDDANVADAGSQVGKRWYFENTNPEKRRGDLSDAMAGADVFIGVSAKDILDASTIKTMAKDPIIFAMANPDPEIRPEAVEGLAAVIATGRSDYPNQINNVLAFPGIFRGALDVRARSISEEMKLSAADALAGCISNHELSPEYIIPSVFDKRVVDKVATAVINSCTDKV